MEKILPQRHREHGGSRDNFLISTSGQDLRDIFFSEFFNDRSEAKVDSMFFVREPALIF